VWGLALLVGLAVLLLYRWLPADGATGDLESFSPAGYRVQWLLEERAGGLRVGDVVVRAGGYTVDEWLRGAARGPEWRSGGLVSYEVLRAGEPLTLSVRLSPVPFRAILLRWTSQLMVVLALLAVGSFVFWRRPHELGARLLMLFCMALALHLWGDAYNFQFSVLPWRWAYWFHLHLEQLSFGLIYAPICHFALVFPVSHPWLRRYPRAALWAIYLSTPLVTALATLLFAPLSRGLELGNRAALLMASVQAAVVFVAFIRSAHIAREPVARAQVRWLLWSAGIVLGVGIPGYLLPLVLAGRPVIPHPLAMLLSLAIPYAWAAAVMRFRLFDIGLIVNRTLVYGTLTLLVGGLYLALVRLLTLWIQLVLHRQDNALVVFIATLTIALAFFPLRQRVQRLIDRAFYRTKLNVQRLLPEMSAKLATCIIPEQLAALLTRELPQRLYIAAADLSVLDMAGGRFVPVSAEGGCAELPVGHPMVGFLRRHGRPLMRLQPPPGFPVQGQELLERNGVELCIPLVVGGEMVGLFSLGPKLSGDVYSPDETDLLYLLGQQAAIAVENSRLYQAEQEQRRLTEALFEERLRLLEKTDAQARQVQQIVGTVPEGVLLLGADWRVLLANPTAREYLAVLADVSEGQPLVHLGQQPIHELLTPPDEGLSHEVALGDPLRRIFEVIARPLQPRGQEGWVLLIREVTREREIQEQVQSQQRLAALGRLAGGIAHDFNNILTVIMLGAENALWEPEVPPAVSSSLVAILAEAKKASDLVRQILDFSRLSWIQTMPLSLEAIVKEVIGILQLTLPENIRLHVEVEPGSYTVDVDPARIQQVVVNLAFNARDVMPQGGDLNIRLGLVEIGADEEAPVAEMPAGKWAFVAVSDTGTGISPDVVPHLFEPFFTTKPVGRGTGLGLAQAYGIVKQHGGYVGVETQVGQGTTFRIYLPIHEETRREGQEKSTVAVPEGKGETILLVEDDEGVRSYCQEILQAIGYRVLPAENGKEAVRVYGSAERIDLLLTDMVMPEMGGRELIARLRAIEPCLRVIVMSGYGLAGVKDLLDEGGVHAVEKPVNSQILAQAVRRILDAE